MTVLLARWEKIKKYKRGKHCHGQQKHLSPFVISVEIMLVRETPVVLSQSIRGMVEKME